MKPRSSIVKYDFVNSVLHHPEDADRESSRRVPSLTSMRETKDRRFQDEIEFYLLD